MFYSVADIFVMYITYAPTVAGKESWKLDARFSIYTTVQQLQQYVAYIVRLICMRDLYPFPFTRDSRNHSRYALQISKPDIMIIFFHFMKNPLFHMKRRIEVLILLSQNRKIHCMYYYNLSLSLSFLKG